MPQHLTGLSLSDIAELHLARGGQRWNLLVHAMLQIFFDLEEQIAVALHEAMGFECLGGALKVVFEHRTFVGRQACLS